MKAELDKDNFQLSVRHDDGGLRTVNLTRLEWAIVNYLWENSHRVVSKKELLEKCWPDYAKAPMLNTVEVYVKYIRNKVGQEFVETRRGFGYKINGEFI